MLLNKKYWRLLGIVLILIGAISLFTNLFGVSAGYGMVVFFATAFPGFILSIGGWCGNWDKETA
jgi:hypothetical protein